MQYVLLALGMAASFALGFIFCKVAFARSCGVLEISYDSYGEGPYLFLNLDEGIDMVKPPKHVIFRTKIVRTRE